MTTANSDDRVLDDISFALSAQVCSKSIDAFVELRARAAAARQEHLKDRREKSRNFQDLVRDLDP